MGRILSAAKERVRLVFRKAIAAGVFINLDMEQYAHKDFLLRLFADLVLEEEFRGYPHFGIVIQATCAIRPRMSTNWWRWRNGRGTPFTVRLVKGAYWDFETVHARQKGWPFRCS